MKRHAAPRPDRLSRRSFLGLASAAVGLGVSRAWADATAPLAAGDAPALEREHVPIVRVPRYPANGAKIPIVVEMDHPMSQGHHVASVRVSNELDPISTKGTFHFTPANGRVYLAFQARMHDGPSEVSVTAECTRHGVWTARSPIEIPAGAGGCTGTAPGPAERASGGEIRGPVIRIPELVESGHIHRGELVHVQVKMKHPSRTGLAFREGRFVQESEPLHLDGMEVRYAGERVSRFAMTSALSDDPFITFTLLAALEGPLTVTLTNCRGQEFEATQQLRFG
jgi:sulfur-oxidizing protein SoxY